MNRYILNSAAAGLCMAIGWVLIRDDARSPMGWGLWIIGVWNLWFVVKWFRGRKYGD